VGPRDRLDYLEQRKIYCPVVIRTSNRPECSLVSVPMLHKKYFARGAEFQINIFDCVGNTHYIQRCGNTHINFID